MTTPWQADKQAHLSKSDRDSITRHITCLCAENARQSFLSRCRIKAPFQAVSFSFSSFFFCLICRKSRRHQNGGTQVRLFRGRKLVFSSLSHVYTSAGWLDIWVTVWVWSVGVICKFKAAIICLFSSKYKIYLLAWTLRGEKRSFQVCLTSVPIYIIGTRKEKGQLALNT